MVGALSASPAAKSALAASIRRRQEPIALVLAATAVAFVVGLPLLELAWELVRAGGTGLDVIARAETWRLMLGTLVIALAVTAIALCLGVPMGAAFARIRLPAAHALFAAHCLPIFVPPLIVALGWFHLAGRGGALGSDASSSLLFGPLGVVAVLASTFTPIVTALTALGVLSVDPSLEDAARVVAPPLRVLARIVVPAAAPAIWFSAIVVFALTVSELGVPSFLRVPVYTTAVFARLGGIDYAPGEAAALTVPMLAVGLLLIAVERRLTRSYSFAVLGLRGARREPLPMPRGVRAMATTMIALAALIAVLPLAALGRVALGGDGLSRLVGWGARPAWNSVAVSLGAAVCISLVSAIAGHALARGRAGATALDAVAMLGFFTPSAVLGAGIIAAYARPGLREVYATGAILVIGLSARYAALGIRTFSASVAQSAPSYEESAMVAGASYLQGLRRIVWPMHRRGIAAAFLLALLFAMRDLDTAVLFYPPGGQPLTVRIFTLEANGPEPVVAALALLQVVLTGIVLALGAWRLGVGWRS